MPPKGEGPRAPELERVRARVHAQVDRLHDVQDLEFVELSATLPEMPFDGDASLEALLTVADYIHAARARFELELEDLKRQQVPKGPAS